MATKIKPHFFITLLVTLTVVTSCDKSSKKADAKSNSNPALATGVIETIVDDHDVRNVNIWSSVTEYREVVCLLKKGQRIEILSENGEYYKIQSLDDENCRGYCMKGSVTL